MTEHAPPHVSGELLDAFVLGTLGERTAARVAEHLDACPRCANLAREADPLARVFASVDDPDVPEDLIAAILAADGAPAVPVPLPWAELALAALLLGGAGLAAWLGVEPASWWSDSRAVGGALLAGAAQAAEHGRLVPTLALLAVLSAVASVAAGRRIA